MTIAAKIIDEMKSIKASNEDVRIMVSKAIQELEKVADEKHFSAGERWDVEGMADSALGKAREFDDKGDAENSQIALAAATVFFGIDDELSYGEGAESFGKALRILKEMGA